MLTSGTGSLDAGTDPNLLAGAVGVDVGETLMLATYVKIFLSTRAGRCEIIGPAISHAILFYIAFWLLSMSYQGGRQTG